MVQEQNGSAPANGLEMGQSNQELVSRKRQRNWKVIGLGGVVLLIICALVIGAIVVLSRGSGHDHAAFQPLRSLQGETSVDMPEVLEGWYNAKGFNGTWISDSEILYRGSHVGQVMLMDLKTRRTRNLVQNEALVPASSIDVEISADRKFLLVSHTYQKLFRHSYLARYDIINLDTLTSVPLANGLGLSDSDVLQVATWAPRGNALVYVYRNNIYYRPDAQDVTEFAITSTGIPGIMYHGVPDWVYEEEVLSSNKALWFSPDGRRLAFASYNDTLVRVMSVPFYGAPGNLEFQYTKTVNIRYPKPGRPNPDVELSIVDLESFVGGNTDISKVLPPDDLVNSEPILTAVTWATNTDLSAVWMNRVQNRARVLVCDATTDVGTSPCREVHKRQERAGWVDIFTPPHFDDLGERFLMILPHEVGNSGPYKHVAMVHPGGVTPLTTGRFVVTEIVSWDQQEKLVYFLSTELDDPSKLHLYSVSDDDRSAPHRPSCLSCSVIRSDCLYNKASFSVNHTYFMLNCAGPRIPEVAIYNKRNELVMYWETNDELRGALYGRALPKPFRLEVEVPGGFKAQVKLMLPPDMDYSGKTKYPLLVNVYGGPDSFQVTQRFGVDWSTYLTVNRSFIYAAIDGRGSGLKGDKMLFSIYRRLGTVEVEDQISVTKYIQDNLNYVDKNRTAIWGWSYGGFSTSMVLANDTNNVFQCGIAVAPVTDWVYYDTIYTERYMGLPTVSDNLQGYSNANLNSKVANLRNKRFLLVHGTLDDNVHYQQSMMLSKSLEQQDILFRQQTYPDEEHGLGGVRTHLYHTLEAFLDDCLHLH